MAWDRTHGKLPGAYLKVGDCQLYVRRQPEGAWSLFVDGRLESTADGESVARAAGELAVRCMRAADVSANATAA